MKFKLNDSGPLGETSTKHLLAPGPDGLRQRKLQQDVEKYARVENVENLTEKWPESLDGLLAQIEEEVGSEIFAAIFNDLGDAIREESLPRVRQLLDDAKAKFGRYRRPDRWVKMPTPLDYNSFCLPAYYSKPIRKFRSIGVREKNTVEEFWLRVAFEVSIAFEKATRGASGLGLRVLAILYHLNQGVFHGHPIIARVDEMGNRLGEIGGKAENGGCRTLTYSMGISSICARRYKLLGAEPIPQIIRSGNGDQRVVVDWELVDKKEAEAKAKGVLLWDVVVNDLVDELVEEFAAVHPALAADISEAKTQAIQTHNARAKAQRKILGVDAQERENQLLEDVKKAEQKAVEAAERTRILHFSNHEFSKQIKDLEIKLADEKEAKLRSDAEASKARSVTNKLYRIIVILLAFVGPAGRGFADFIKRKIAHQVPVIPNETEAMEHARKLVFELSGNNAAEPAMNQIDRGAKP